MEPLVVTSFTPEWREVEVLQWMERNTLKFYDGPFGDQYVAPLNSTYQSKKKINELLGINEVLR